MQPFGLRVCGRNAREKGEQEAMDGQTGVPAPAAPAASVPAAGQPPTAEGPVQRLVYDGRLGELYRIYLVNLLLGLVTLGVYRFWGKTRMRRYLWSHFAFDRDRFEYTGTGGELFRGFIVVAAVLLVLSLALAGKDLVLTVMFSHDPLQGMLIGSGINLLIYVVFFYLLMVGRYMALRYRLSRSRWRGIRGGLAGSPWKYGISGFAWTLAVGASLGFAKPVADIALTRLQLRNFFFGTAQAKLTADDGTRGLYGPYTASWFATVAGFALTYGVVIGMIFASFDVLQGLDQNSDADISLGEMFNDPEGRALVLRIVAAGLATAIPAWILVLFARSWYAAVLLRRIAEMVTLGGVQPRATVATLGLWWLSTGNMLISLFTLGLGTPIVLHRTARFTADRLALDGAIDGAAIGQSRQAIPSRGEGLLEAFDAGGAF